MIERIMDKIFTLRDLSEIQNSIMKKFFLLLLFYILAFIMFPLDVFKEDKIKFLEIVLSWCSILIGVYLLI